MGAQFIGSTLAYSLKMRRLEKLLYLNVFLTFEAPELSHPHYPSSFISNLNYVSRITFFKIVLMSNCILSQDAPVYLHKQTLILTSRKKMYYWTWEISGLDSRCYITHGYFMYYLQGCPMYKEFQYKSFNKLSIPYLCNKGFKQKDRKQRTQFSVSCSSLLAYKLLVGTVCLLTNEFTVKVFSQGPLL